MTNDNPPAFPKPYSYWEDGYDGESYPAQQGMDLLDYFAGQALASLIITKRSHINIKIETLATWSYDQAEAMLAERKKRMEGDKECKP